MLSSAVSLKIMTVDHYISLLLSNLMKMLFHSFQPWFGLLYSR